MPATTTLWAARLAWVVVAVVGGQAIGDAVAGRSDAVQVAATVAAWLAWAAGALALTVPSVATLTAMRAIVPGAVLVGVATALFGAGTSALALVVPAAVAAVLAGAAETGRGLRAGLGVRGRVQVPAATAARVPRRHGRVVGGLGGRHRRRTAGVGRPRWVLAVVVTVVAVTTTLLLPRRWHQLSRRWLVAVPAGLVVHDPVVLADTVMLPRRVIAGVAAGERGAGAADLTGPTPGLVVAIEVRDVVPMVLAPRPGSPRGRRAPGAGAARRAEPPRFGAGRSGPPAVAARLTTGPHRLDPAGSSPPVGTDPAQMPEW